MDTVCPGWRAEAGVVAVSGGADSVALLCLLAGRASDGSKHEPSLARPANKTTLIVVHLNHMLRGAESDADEAFVIELATRLELKVRTAHIPVPLGNLENEARKMRYEFLRAVAEECGAGWIATAHTMDDQAETVLHRLIRGTGIQGLRGIQSGRTLSINPPPDSLRESTSPTGGEVRKPKSFLPTSPLGGEVVPTCRDEWGVAMLRPLLDIRRADLREYLRSINQPFREDASNLDVRFTRNRIRHELLPMLETFNPRIAEVLNRLSQQAAELYEFTEGETALLLKVVELPRAGAMLIFDVEKLEKLPEPQRRAVLRMAWQRECWPMLEMSFAHWERLAKLESSDFPGGVRSERRARVFQLQGDSRRPAF
jgi:tRNA(Ile)-lysidine synthase